MRHDEVEKVGGSLRLLTRPFLGFGLRDEDYLYMTKNTPSQPCSDLVL